MGLRGRPGRARGAIGCLALAGLVAAGCIAIDADRPCGAGAELVNGSCRPSSSSNPCDVDAGRSWPADAGAPPGMGETCVTSPDCSKQANYCAYDPAAQVGQCTVADCTTSPESCPPGYRCFDATAFGLVKMCIPEASWAQLNCQ